MGFDYPKRRLIESHSIIRILKNFLFNFIVFFLFCVFSRMKNNERKWSAYALIFCLGNHACDAWADCQPLRNPQLIWENLYVCGLYFQAPVITLVHAINLPRRLCSRMNVFSFRRCPWMTFIWVEHYRTNFTLALCVCAWNLNLSMLLQ